MFAIILDDKGLGGFQSALTIVVESSDGTRPSRLPMTSLPFRKSLDP